MPSTSEYSLWTRKWTKEWVMVFLFLRATTRLGL